MKLVKLEILNLASLDNKDGEVIHFEEGALGESSIFSIVGPMGSGKSTLLDAICLALYNRAPRYPRKKGDRNQGIEIYGQLDPKEKNRLAPTDSRNILTHGKKFGYSRLTFVANNGCMYRAEWSVRFMQKCYENAVTTLVKITSENGTPKEEAADWNQLPQIIGLDYEQFLRTVLIAQGSFANFLNAKEDERYELLEKLVGCEETYTRIANAIMAKKEEANDAFKAMSTSIAADQQFILSDDDFLKLQEEIKTLEAAEKILADTLKSVKEQLQWYTDEIKQAEVVKGLQDKLNQAVEAFEKGKTTIDRLLLHDAIAPAINLLQEVKRLEQEMGELKGVISDNKVKIEHIEQEKTKELETLAQLNQNVAEAQKAIEEKSPHIKKARELKTKIESATQTCMEKKKAKETSEAEKLAAEKAVNDNENLLKAAQAAVEKATQGEYDVEALQRGKADADQAFNAIKQATEVTDRYERAQKETALKNARRNALLERNKTIAETFAKLNTDDLAKEIETLRKTHTLMTSENWALHRSTLEEGKPCPLCGATSHPYQLNESHFNEAKSSLEKLLEDKMLVLTEQKTMEKRLSDEKSTNDGEIHSIDERLEQLRQDTGELEKQRTQLFGQYPGFPKTKGELEALVPFFAEKQKQAGDALAQYLQMQVEIKRLAEVKALKPNLLQQQEEKRKALANACDEWQKAEDNLKTLEALYKAELNGEAPDAVEERLNKTKADADKAVKEKNEYIKLLEVRLGEHRGALTTKEGQLKTDETNRETKNAELARWIAAYNAKEDRLRDIEVKDVEEMRVASDNWDALRQEKERLNNTIVSAKTLLEKAKETQTEHQRSKPEKTQEELLAEQTELQKNSQGDALIVAKTKLKNHNDALQRLGGKADELARLTKAKDDWAAIAKAIGGDGKTLRKIAQCYTLGFLIEHANAEIRKFNSRYELMQVKNSLGIRVIDHDRADDIRDITSLSGGETFVVSLGLALGLSALSSRNISFENLFIDEGFGTLDPDTLATVIDSLAMLQSKQGKKVGVISHTDTMSERITTQIRIVKNGNSGSSHIEIYP